MYKETVTMKTASQAHHTTACIHNGFATAHTRKTLSEIFERTPPQSSIFKRNCVR
jgi:hypothetical protein